MSDLFLKACQRKPVERTPVWIMRQAGRYLPEYRSIRAKVDFLTLCKTPDLAAEVTVQPVDRLGVDAAIVFSDILIVPEGMGMELVIDEPRGGPRFPNPIRSRRDIEALRMPDPNEKTGFVMEAIRRSRNALAGRAPVIGFSGSPWTLAAYMVQGNGAKNFRLAKQLVYGSSTDCHTLLEKLARTVTDYLNAQIEAGANAIQIFDTWGGLLSKDMFKEFSLAYIVSVIAGLRRNGVPIIVFCKGCGHSLREIAASGADVVGLDWTVDIGEARRSLENGVALQGNLDPHALYSGPDRIREEVKTILSKYGRGTGHVFNLGHGILPDVPVENAQALVKAVQEESRAYH